MQIHCDLDCSKIVLAVLKISAVVIGLVATIIVLKLCTNHLRHYTNPYFQNKIIGKQSLLLSYPSVIVLIVPIYSIVAVAAVVLAKDESVIEFLEVFRTMYEAILIVSFF